MAGMPSVTNIQSLFSTMGFISKKTADPNNPGSNFAFHFLHNLTSRNRIPYSEERKFLKRKGHLETQEKDMAKQMAEPLTRICKAKEGTSLEEEKFGPELPQSHIFFFLFLKLEYT